jgi:hypothetical protein
MWGHTDGMQAHRNSGETMDVPLTMYRIMNQGSPYNVPAGQTANMDKVIAKFRKEAAEDNERKLEASRTNTVVGEQPFERFSPTSK